MAQKSGRSRSHPGDMRSVQLIGVIVLSLALWVAIWDAFASLTSAVFR